MSTKTLALCPDCLQWVQLRAERCPICSHPVDIFTADPSREELQSRLGELCGELGEVWVREQGFNELGILYSTTNGLLFVPHEIEEYWQMVSVPRRGSSLFWHLAAMAWSPLMIALPLLRRFDRESQQRQRFRPRALSSNDPAELSHLLMENPGCLFLSRDRIFGIRRKRRCWLVDRPQAKPLKLFPVQCGVNFQDAVREISALNTWRGIAFRL